MTYRKDIDALKGIAIIAVVFYHLGILRSGPRFVHREGTGEVGFAGCDDPLHHALMG